MILPNKHLGLSRSVLGVGAILLKEMTDETTVSMLWERVRERPEIRTFELFLLCLDMLYALGLVSYNKHDLLVAAKR